jgi:hypothetical protein
LLGGIFREELLEGDGLEIDGFELGRGGERRVFLRGEFDGVRHCCDMLGREGGVGLGLGS